MKTKVKNKQINLKIKSLNLDLTYFEVYELISLIPKRSELYDLKKDLTKWYVNTK